MFFNNWICGYKNIDSNVSIQSITPNVNNRLIIDSFKKFDLDGIEGKFYVESVYDGDTITILVPIQTHIYNMIGSNSVNFDSDSNKSNKIYFNKIRLRLLGIDTPEIKPRKDIPDRDNHIAKAKEAKEFLSNQILNKIINVKFMSNDKYGRPLANLYQNNININELMIEKGYAKKYDGGTKDMFFLF